MRTHALSFVLLSAAMSAAQAQELPANYAAALQQALLNRLEVRMDRAGNAMAAAKVSEAKAAFLPTFTAYSTMQHVTLYNDFSPVKISFNYDNQNVPVTVANSLPPYEFGTGLDLHYNLYSGGADKARLDAAYAAQRAADASAQITRRQLVEDITKAYWTVVKAKVDARRIRRAMDQAYAEAEAASVQYQQGNLAQVESEVKALAAQVQETEWRNSQRALGDLVRRYILAIGIESKPQYVQALQQTSFIEDVESINALNPEAVLEGLDLLHSAEVKKERAEFDGATAAILQARADNKPTLDFFVRYNGVGRSASGFANALHQYNRDVSYVGFQLTWKIFDGFRTDSRVNHAVAAAEKKRWMIESAVRKAEYEWQDKSSRVIDLNDKLSLLEKQLALGEAQLKVAQVRLNTKLTSTLQTRAVLNAVEDAREKIISLKIDLFVAKVEALLARPQ